MYQFTRREKRCEMSRTLATLAYLFPERDPMEPVCTDFSKSGRPHALTQLVARQNTKEKANRGDQRDMMEGSLGALDRLYRGSIGKNPIWGLPGSRGPFLL